MQAIYAVINTLSREAQSASYRALNNSVLGAWVNLQLREYHSDTAQAAQFTRLDKTGFAGIDLLNEILAEEAEKSQAKELFGGSDIPAPLDTMQLISIHEFVKNRGHQISTNAFERPMSLVQWLKFLATSAQKGTPQQLIDAVVQFTGVDSEAVRTMTELQAKEELQRLSDAIPTIIKQYDQQLKSCEDGEYAEVNAFHQYKFAVKIANTLKKDIERTTNNALKYRRLELLTTVGLLREDHKRVVELVQMLENDASDALAEAWNAGINLPILE